MLFRSLPLLTITMLLGLDLPTVDAGWFEGPKPLTINLNKYAGPWYEIASSYIPKLTFERGLGCVMAKYEVKTEGQMGQPYVDVVNQGVNIKTHEATSVHAKALPLDTVSDEGETVAKLAVDFSPKPKEGRPSMANYLVIYLGGDYQTAVVTDPFRATLFFLSRTPTIADEEYGRMEAASRDQGLILWLIGLVRTNQDPALCGRAGDLLGSPSGPATSS